MTAAELRRFLDGRMDSELPVAAVINPVPGEEVEILETVGEMREAILELEDDEPISFTTPLGVWNVLGFKNSSPPTLFVHRSVDSIESN